MAQLSKLEELLSSGIGGKSAEQTSAQRTLHLQQVKSALGTVSPVSENLFLAINGRMTKSHQAGLIDVMVVECLGFGKSIASTPSGRFADQEYAVAAPTYNAIREYAKKVRGTRSVAGTLVGSSILRPAVDDGKVPALISYSFFAYGSRGGQDTVTIGGKPFPRTQYNPRFVRNAICGICKQLTSGTFCASYPAGRKIRIGLPRILGGIGGILFADLLELLSSITSEFPAFEFYVFTNSQPDDAVVVGVEPPKVRRKTNERSSEKKGKVRTKRR